MSSDASPLTTTRPATPSSAADAPASPVSNVQLEVSANAMPSSPVAEVRSQAGSRWSLAADASAPSPMEALLGALAGCQVLTYQYWAARLGLAVEDCQATVEGRFDPRGFQGDPAASGVGFSDLRVTVHLQGPEPVERYQVLADEVDRHCPVHDTLGHGVPIDRVLQVHSPSD
jgi:uncharacterized OsmC-like protein